MRCFGSYVRRAFEQAINEKVAVPRGDKTVLMTRVEIGLEQLLDQFAKDERHARRDLMEYADKLGIDFLDKHRQTLEQALTADYRAILAASLARRSGNVALAPRVLASPALLDDDAAEPEPTLPSPPPEAEIEPEPEPEAEPPQKPGVYPKPFTQTTPLQKRAWYPEWCAQMEKEMMEKESAKSHAPGAYPPGLVLRATLALDFMAFTEFAFRLPPTH